MTTGRYKDLIDELVTESKSLDQFRLKPGGASTDIFTAPQPKVNIPQPPGQNSREWWQFWQDKPIRGLEDKIPQGWEAPKTFFGQPLAPKSAELLTPKELLDTLPFVMGMTGNLGATQKAASQATTGYQKVTAATTPVKEMLTVDKAREALLTKSYDRIWVLNKLEKQTGIPVHQYGQVVPGATGAGENIIRTQVRPVLKDLNESEIKELEKWMVLKRSEDIFAKYQSSNLPGGMTGWGDILGGEKVIESSKSFPKIEKAAKELWRINDEYILKPLLDEGIISPETWRDLKATYPHYIDFHRADFSLLDDAFATMARPEASVSSTGLKRINPLGSERVLDNPLARVESQIIRTQNLIFRNRAAKAIVVALDDLGTQTNNPLIKYLKSGEAAEHSNITDTISFFNQGKKVTVQVPTEYAVAAKSMDIEPSHGLIRLIQALNTPLKAGATKYNPAFTVVVNPIMDATSAWFREKLVPLSPDYLRGWMDAITKNSTFDELARQGGLMSGIIETQRTTEQLARQAVKGELAVKNVKDVFTFLPRLNEWFGQTGERATRIATYLKLKGLGIDALEATVRARDVTVDFSKMGTTMKWINQVIPFSNASLQGSANLLRTQKSKPAWALIASAPLGMATIGSWINNSRFESSNKIPDYEYRRNWVYQVAEGKSKNGDTFPIYVKIPKGPIGSVVTAPIEMLMRLAWNNNDRSVIELLLDTAGGMATALSPIEPTLSGTMIPIMGTAAGEAANYDFYTGQPIVPQGQEQLLPEQQFGPDTSTTAVALGQKFKISPRKIDFAIKDYLAGAGQAGNWLLSMGLEALGWRPEQYAEAKYEPPTTEQKIAKMPIASRVMGTKATGQENLQWDKLDKLSEKGNRDFAQIPDMNRLGIRLGETGRTLQNKELEVEDRVHYQELLNEYVVNATQKAVSSRGFQALKTDAAKKYYLQNIMDDARENVRLKMILYLRRKK